MKTFNAVCFAVLMDHHHRGIEEAHPHYVEEKLQVFETCEAGSAFSLLDTSNQHRVLQWCKNWNIPTDFIYSN